MKTFIRMAAALIGLAFSSMTMAMYFDAESGLSYNINRSYRSADGRYTQPDPIGLDGGINRYPYANLNPMMFTDPNGLNPLAGATGGAEIGAIFGPVGAVVGGVIGAGAGAWIGWNALGPVLSDSSAPPRGLPPEGIKPPIPDADQCKPGPASRPSERDKGGQSLWDPSGGEWRWFPGNKWHNPHWDHNAHDRKGSRWVNVPHGDLPPIR